MSERYTIISADSHAGGNMAAYEEYLPAEWRDAYNDWRGGYQNPYRDLQDDGRTRNWDNERRVSEQYADGVVAEITFPNTVPPFYPTVRCWPDRPRMRRVRPTQSRTPVPALAQRLVQRVPRSATRPAPDLPRRPR